MVVGVVAVVGLPSRGIVVEAADRRVTAVWVAIGIGRSVVREGEIVGSTALSSPSSRQRLKSRPVPYKGDGRAKLIQNA